MSTKPKQKPHATAPKKPVQHLVVVPDTLLEERRRDASTLISALSAAAADPKSDIDKIERLWAIQKEALAMRAEQEFAQAKNALARNMPTILKNHVIKFIDKKGNTQETPYADREDIEYSIGPIYLAAGFSTEYSTEYVDGKIQTIMCLRHNSGHKEFYKAPPMPLDTSGSKNNNQAAGSTMEYGSRYCLRGAFNVIGTEPKPKEETINEVKSDKFSARVGEQSGNGDIIDIEPTQKEKDTGRTPLEIAQAAAQKLEEKLLSVDVIERRGQILMANIRIVKELEIHGDPERATTLRALAEGNPDGQ